MIYVFIVIITINQISYIMTTHDIVQKFISIIDNDANYSISEMKNVLSAVYKAMKTPVKKPIVNNNASDTDDDSPKKKGRPAKPRLNKDGSVKQKKAPSAYNLYVKGKYAELKSIHTDKKAPDIMKIAAASWKELTDEEKETFKLTVILKPLLDKNETKIVVEDVILEPKNENETKIVVEDVILEPKNETKIVVEDVIKDSNHEKNDEAEKVVEVVEVEQGENKELIDNIVSGDIPQIKVPTKKKGSTVAKKGKAKKVPENTFIDDEDE